jgi:hypothetical protein
MTTFLAGAKKVVVMCHWENNTTKIPRPFFSQVRKKWSFGVIGKITKKEQPGAVRWVV